MWRYDILTCEDIDDFGDIRFVSYIVLKFVGVSSKHLRVYLESLRQSSEIFGHLRTSSEILGKCSGTFVWSSGQFWKIFGNLRKVVGNLRKIIKKRRYQCFYVIKRTLHVSSKIWILCYSWQEQYLTRSLRSLVRYCSCHSNIKFISSRHRVISSIYFFLKHLSGPDA